MEIHLTMFLWWRGLLWWWRLLGWRRFLASSFNSIGTNHGENSKDENQDEGKTHIGAIGDDLFNKI
uniref:Uncharacterized protein n=1 Tax=Tetranychus urticae TaxID=32264 RepID=T1JVS3_TETUR